MSLEKSAKSLGWASIGIGLSEIAAPQQLERLMGIGNGRNTGILRVLGVREVMHGVDILAHRDPTPGVWSRVFGDVLDTALLVIAGTKTRRPGSFAAVFAMVMGIGLLDGFFANALAAKKLAR